MIRDTPTRSGKTPTSASGGSRRREVVGILVGAVALFLLLSVGSLHLGSGRLMGPCGAWVGLAAWALLGLGAYLFAIGLGAIAVALFRGRAIRLRSVETLGWVGAAIALSILIHLAAGHYRLHGYGAGGLLGEYGAELLVALVGKVGTVLVAVVVLALACVACTPITIRGVGRVAARAAGWAWRNAMTSVMAIFPERDEDDEVDGDDEEPDEESEHEPAAKPIHDRETQLLGRAADDTVVEEEKPKRRRKKEEPAPAIVVEEAAPAEVADDRTEAVSEPPVMTETDDKIAEPPAPAIIAPAPRKTPTPPPPRPPEPSYTDFELPGVALLDEPESGHGELDRQAMLELAGRLEKTLADYGVRGRVSEIHPGPVVTMYEFVPQAGTKLSKITALSSDLAMALEALKVRIVAPIPGKAAVGIEVPNKVRETVYLKEILADDAFTKAKSKLTLALGKDIVGHPTCVDLAKMPHLLIAGTTGSGKSVSVNAMICSLLFNATPDEVKLIMIDPKMLELSIYEGIPHLLLPVVTDPKKANLALRWAVDEMERRYDLISKSGVRDIASYNKKIGKQLEGTVIEPPPPEKKKIKVTITDESGVAREAEVDADVEAVRAAGGIVSPEVIEEISAAHAAAQAVQKNDDGEKAAEPPKKLPYIVVIIDEFADLMMVASKEVETSVARIAQKARAAGIHLLLATQRPSVDVITGLIKANFPSRIAFQVASKIDARTILDQQGAESLLGAGDMLFTDRGMALKRIHGPLVTDVEIHKMVEFLKQQGKPVYDLDILKPRADEEGDGEGDEDFADEMYDQAVALVAETRQASISMIQRRLRVGYNRAARMVERMEREGIVGPADGVKGREVLVGHHAA